MGDIVAYQSIGADAASAIDTEPHLHLPPFECDLVLVPDHALLTLQGWGDTHIVRAGDGI